MSRLYHSGNRLDAELLSGGTWAWVVERYNEAPRDIPGAS